MRHRLFLIIVLIGLSVSLYAQHLSSEARISLLTCTPGDELYARYGHTALRVCDHANDIDAVFNYGIFNFNTEHFYWKFVKGETWYELGAYPYVWFMYEYDETHRAVYEQVLNLDSIQRQALWDALLTNYQPENRQYLYNFVFDNCATRPYVLLTRIISDSIVSDYTGYTGNTYRSFIRHYTGAWTYANAGINLVFGPKADQPMTSDQRLFLPEELMKYLQSAYTLSGKPLIVSSTIAPFVIAATPWYASWPFGLILYFLLVAGISFYDRRRGKWSWGLELAAGIPYALLLVIVIFLTFFSIHPLVGFGWRLLILPLTHLCARLIYIVR